MQLICEISQKEFVKGLPKISFDNDSTCKFCQRSKQTKSSFHSKNVVSTASLSDKKYGLVIVDDFSRFTWVIFLIHEDEACEAFKSFSKRIQNEKGFCITSIRSNHGGEFENHSF